MSFGQAAAPIAYKLPLSHETVAPQQTIKHSEELLPRRTRTALLVGTSAGLWGIILCVGYFVVTALI